MIKEKAKAKVEEKKVHLHQLLLLVFQVLIFKLRLKKRHKDV